MSKLPDFSSLISLCHQRSKNGRFGGVHYYTDDDDDDYLRRTGQIVVWLLGRMYGVGLSTGDKLEALAEVASVEELQCEDSEARKMILRAQTCALLQTFELSNEYEIETLEKYASEGDVYAMHVLGKCYSLKQDKEEAVKWFEEAAELGNVEAIIDLGVCHVRGLGVPQDFKTAVECFKLALSLGSDDAVFLLAQCYFHGRGINRNMEKAVELVKHASSMGNRSALITLSQLYDSGLGVPVNYDKSVELYVQSVMGYPEAMKNLASRLRKGEGVRKDEKKAAELEELADSMEDESCSIPVVDLSSILKSVFNYSPPKQTTSAPHK